MSCTKLKERYQEKHRVCGLASHISLLCRERLIFDKPSGYVFWTEVLRSAMQGQNNLWVGELPTGDRAGAHAEKAAPHSALEMWSVLTSTCCRVEWPCQTCPCRTPLASTVTTELLSGCQKPVRAEFTLVLSRVLYTMPAETFNHNDFSYKRLSNSLASYWVQKATRQCIYTKLREEPGIAVR